MTHDEPRQVLVTPAVDISIVFSPDGGRAFQMRFAPLPTDMDEQQLNEVLDKVLRCVERQRAKYELEDEESLLADQVGRLRKYEANMVALEESSKSWWEAEGRKGEWSPAKGFSSTALNEREKLSIALTSDRNDAKNRQDKIARLRAKVNGHAVEFRADSNTSLPNR